MFKSVRNLLIILMLYFSAIGVANKFNPNQIKSVNFKNTAELDFLLVTTEEREFHKLYKRSSTLFLKKETIKEGDDWFSMNRPYEFYLSVEDLKPNNFSKFIAETDYTFDYLFNNPDGVESSEASVVISRQDAQSFANWLSSKERVSYQIVDNKEIDYACKNFSKSNASMSFWKIKVDKFEKLCQDIAYVETIEKLDSNGFRLIRDVD